MVLFVGDGFGISHLTLARHALRGPEGRLALETLPVVGLVTTYSASNAVTDSGAAATAFAAGVKSDNRFIGLDADRRGVRTIGEEAAERGWRHGYVTTTRITHATPACFFAHHADRYDETAIAAQLVAHMPDLALGGGLTEFLPLDQHGTRQDGRDLVAEARRAGIAVLERGSPLAAPAGARVLGLFAMSHLAYQLDDRELPRERRDPALADMTRFALERLGAGGGSFFLMVEGGRIDHAAHGFDAAGVVAEVAAFDEAVATAIAYQRDHPATLLLATADHSTGGLMINDWARWEDLSRHHASLDALARQIRDAAAGTDLLAEKLGYPDFTPADLAAVRAAPTSYDADRALGSRVAQRDGFTWLPRVFYEATDGHTGEDVMLFAGGPGAERFAGHLDNTDIPKRIAALLGWEPPNP